MSNQESTFLYYPEQISNHVRKLIEGAADPLNHPIGRQFVISAEELHVRNWEIGDPIGDDKFSPLKGLIHRYPDRVLIKATESCAVRCRYCFRREMLHSDGRSLSEADFYAIFSYLKEHEEVSEVVLSGGDPLVLSSRRLEAVLRGLDDIEHIQVVRIHTRVPVVDPERVDDGVLNLLKDVGKPIHIVLHINHADEITEDVKRTLRALREAGCSLYSQSVLLKGVNDDPDVLAMLFRSLLKEHVKPYYIHHLDLAVGTSHFRVSLVRGKEIMRALQGRVSGLALPKYMLDIPQGYGKVPVNEGYVCARGDGVYDVQDYQGGVHEYVDYGDPLVQDKMIEKEG